MTISTEDFEIQTSLVFKKKNIVMTQQKKKINVQLTSSEFFIFYGVFIFLKTGTRLVAEKSELSDACAPYPTLNPPHMRIVLLL